MVDFWNSVLSNLSTIVLGFLPLLGGFILTTFIKWIWDNPKVSYLVFDTFSNDENYDSVKNCDLKSARIVSRRIPINFELISIQKSSLNPETLEMENIYSTLKKNHYYKMVKTQEKGQEEPFLFNQLLSIKLAEPRCPINFVIKVPKRLVKQKGHPSLDFSRLMIRWKSATYIAARMLYLGNVALAKDKKYSYSTADIIKKSIFKYYLQLLYNQKAVWKQAKKNKNKVS